MEISAGLQRVGHFEPSEVQDSAYSNRCITSSGDLWCVTALCLSSLPGDQEEEKITVVHTCTAYVHRYADDKKKMIGLNRDEMDVPVSI